MRCAWLVPCRSVRGTSLRCLSISWPFVTARRHIEVAPLVARKSERLGDLKEARRDLAFEVSSTLPPQASASQMIMASLAVLFWMGGLMLAS